MKCCVGRNFFLKYTEINWIQIQSFLTITFTLITKKHLTQSTPGPFILYTREYEYSKDKQNQSLQIRKSYPQPNNYFLKTRLPIPTKMKQPLFDKITCQLYLNYRVFVPHHLKNLVCPQPTEQVLENYCWNRD